MKKFFGILLLSFFSFYCFSQDTIQKVDKAFDFFDITFYSSECNGVCPDIIMNIDRRKRIQLIRNVFKSKGVIEESRSGSFKGELNKSDFDKLVSLVKEIDWEQIEWPKITCCDLPVKTIIVGKYKFKSMKWPQEANKLVEFLTQLAVSVKLPSYTGPMDFEVIED